MDKKFTGKKNDSPFLVYSGNKKELQNFLDDTTNWRQYATGWKDKKGNPGITLTCAENKKQGTIVCLSEIAHKDAVAMIEKHMYMMGWVG